MPVEAAVPADSPLMIAWEAYKKTPEFANTLKWATHPEHAVGSLWASFCAGRESLASQSGRITCEHGVVGYCEPCALRDHGELGETKPRLVAVLSRRKSSRELVEEARRTLLAAWEKSNQGALGPISTIISALDDELAGRPLRLASATGEPKK